MTNRRLLLTSALTLCIAASFPAYAAEPPAVKSEFEKALMEGKPLFLSRYRYEYVDQDGLPEDAHAHTLACALELCGLAVSEAKSLLLSLVSVQPESMRVMAIVLVDGVGAADEPSKQFVKMP